MDTNVIHKIAGVIEAAGRQVNKRKPGDWVTVTFVGGCRNCPQHISGNHPVCDSQFQPGFTHWGSFAEYVFVDNADINLVSLPNSLDYVTAANLGCRFVTSYRQSLIRGRS